MFAATFLLWGRGEREAGSTLEGAAPAGTAAEIVTRLNRELDNILKTPEVVNRLAELGFLTEGADTPETTRAFVRAQYELWSKVIREIGLQPQ